MFGTPWRSTRPECAGRMVLGPNRILWVRRWLGRVGGWRGISNDPLGTFAVAEHHLEYASTQCLPKRTETLEDLVARVEESLILQNEHREIMFRFCTGQATRLPLVLAV